MKRRSFIVASSAATLAACSGGGSPGPARVVPTAPTPMPSPTSSNVPLGVPQSALANPILGETYPTSGSGAYPAAWVPCDGRTLQISQYPSLFALLGKTFGGDGKKTFLLPKTSHPYIIAIVGEQPTSPAMLASYVRRRGTTGKATGLPAPFVFPKRPAEPVIFVAKDDPVSPPPIGSISEHARFSQVLRTLDLDASQEQRIVELNDSARAASSATERRRSAEAVMATIRDTVLRDDQRTTMLAQMSAWKAAHG